MRKESAWALTIFGALLTAGISACKNRHENSGILEDQAKAQDAPVGDTDPPNGSDAPGKIHCGADYFAPGLTQSPSGDTTTPTTTAKLFKVSQLDNDAGFKYMFGGAKSATAAAGDDLIKYVLSVQINKDGLSMFTVNISSAQGVKQLTGLGAWSKGIDTEFDLPLGPDAQFQDRNVSMVKFHCFQPE